jgi:hypothetical protein
MQKPTLIFLSTLTLFASESCLECHKKQQIPSELIYKRYLLKYSTKNRIEKAMFLYLKNPNPKNSIMPKPFFSKFPMKKATNIDDKSLKKAIERYIEKFDVKKKLVIGK